MDRGAGVLIPAPRRLNGNVDDLGDGRFDDAAESVRLAPRG